MLETPFHIRVNNHSKDINNSNAIEECQHFNNWSHVFHRQRKFILIEQINNIKNTSTEALKQRLKDRENYWIKLTSNNVASILENHKDNITLVPLENGQGRN